MLRELTDEEKLKYQEQIKISRKEADTYVFGYKKKEMIDNDEKSIKTLAYGEPGVGWVVVAHCSFENEI